jgi:SAM-dependent methyltransferase
MDDSAIKQQVRQFYDQVGWQIVGEGLYQNARYEDLRPVSRAYIHHAHLRVGQCLPPSGRYLLDAGSGPIQYPEYLTYSQGYTYRVCVDISIVALQEARKRIGERGLFVVADVAHLPFRPEAFQGVVSLHTLHHLPPQDHGPAYVELFRVLAPGGSAAVVNGWTEAPLQNWLWKPVRLAQAFVALLRRLTGQRKAAPSPAQPAKANPAAVSKPADGPTGTYVHKFTPDWLKQTLGGKIPFEIRAWRSVNVGFLRAAIHPRLAGRFWLGLLAWFEDRFPRWFGEKGQYPLIVLRKPEQEKRG